VEPPSAPTFEPPTPTISEKLPGAPTFEHPPSSISGKPFTPPEKARPAMALKKLKKSKEASKPTKKQKARIAEKPSDKPVLVAPPQPPIVGTSTELEKQYLRLTGEQKDRDPSLFRPLLVLKRSFDHCMRK
jgi:hypothetical protein